MFLCAADINTKVLGDISEGEVNMRVLVDIDLIDTYSQAFAVEVPRLKIRNPNHLRRRVAFNNLHAATGDTFLI